MKLNENVQEFTTAVFFKDIQFLFSNNINWTERVLNIREFKHGGYGNGKWQRLALIFYSFHLILK